MCIYIRFSVPTCSGMNSIIFCSVVKPTWQMPMDDLFTLLSLGVRTHTMGCQHLFCKAPKGHRRCPTHLSCNQNLVHLSIQS